ncbi:MAG TPA: protein translocase subunit SecF [Balneolales bacterium]|nr:protein translocase subunit SecF [Balneolales bacterium]
MRIFENADYPMIDIRKITYAISGSLILISIIAIFIRGLQFGIDFKGGKEYIIEFQKDVTVTQTRSVLTKSLGKEPEVKLFGSPRDLLIRTDAPGDQAVLEQKILGSLSDTYPGNTAKVIKTDIVGPRFAQSIKIAAMYSIFTSIVVIFLYILIRFRKWTYSAGAIIALIHDVTITLGFFTIFDKILPFNMDINESLIAAFLTIVGYSINDTVVVYDRIRENLNIFKTDPFEKTVNKSINDTLSRTIITSGTTLFVVVVLFIFGGQVLKGLSLALIIGITVGTYSSIFIASALVVDFQKRVVKSVKKAVTK